MLYILVTCNTLINGLCGTRNTAMALEFLQEMVSAKGVDCNPNVVTYNTIIDAFCKEGAMDKASMLFDEMTDSGIHPNVVTCNTIIHGYSVQSRWKECIRIFKEMVDKGLSPDTVTFTTPMNSLSTSMEQLLRHANYST